EGHLHALSPAYLADPARAARLRGLARRPARVPRRDRGGRSRAQRPHGRLLDVDRRLGAELAPAWAGASRAKAALPQACPGDGRGQPRHRMIDTHAHLAPAEADEVLARARAAGVDRVIAVATTIPGCREALELAGRHNGVFACLGVHPHEAG